MSTTEKEVYYAVIDADIKSVLVSTIDSNRHYAIKAFLNRYDYDSWKDAKKHGFYTVRIEIFWEAP